MIDKQRNISEAGNSSESVCSASNSCYKFDVTYDRCTKRGPVVCLAYSKTIELPEDIDIVIDAEPLCPDSVDMFSLQNEIGKWGTEAFNTKRLKTETHISDVVEHLHKEYIELRIAAYASRNYCDKRAVAEEAADCVILLYQLAYMFDFDLIDEARRKFEINKQRTWGDPDESGVIEHIKE